MVIALKCFDPKHLLVSPCEENNFIFELEPLSVAQEIAKLGFVAEAGMYWCCLLLSCCFKWRCLRAFVVALSTAREQAGKAAAC